MRKIINLTIDTPGVECHQQHALHGDHRGHDRLLAIESFVRAVLTGGLGSGRQTAVGLWVERG